MEKNKSVLWQPFPMFWDFHGFFLDFYIFLYMGFSWCLILVGSFLGFS